MYTILVQPPNMQRKGKWKQQKVYRTPTNLAILAAYLRENGHEVRILDLDVDGGTFDDMVDNILANEPEVIGFTCLTPRYPIVQELAGACKESNPKVKIVLGGPHVSGCIQSVLEEELIDYGIMGEGEGALLDLLNAIESESDTSEIANLILKKNGKPIVNSPRPFIEDLDALPMPAWDLLSLNEYTDPAFFEGAHLGIMSARGCPFNCNFCASKVVWGRRVRYRSPQNIISEIELSINKYNIHEFMFYDDTFTMRKKRIIEFCDLIDKKGLNIRFYAQARVDTIDVELAVRLKNSGCFALAIGVESGDDHILAKMGKNVTKQQIRKGCLSLKKAGMPFLASYIIGHPGDTHETIQATIDFADELDADQAKFLIATPYPGTKLFDLAVKAGLLSENGAENLGDHTYFQHVAANLSCVSDDDLLKYQQKAFDDYDERKRPIV